MVGGGSEEQVEALRAYGLDTGLAFQIQDDLLNLVGTKEAKEKDYRSDITEGQAHACCGSALQNTTKRERLVEILSSKETGSSSLSRKRFPSCVRRAASIMRVPMQRS